MAEKNDLAERRRRLKVRVDQFQREAHKMMPLLSSEVEEMILVATQNDGEDLEEESEELGEELKDLQEWLKDDNDQEDQPLETRQLLLPSAIPSKKHPGLDIQEVVL